MTMMVDITLSHWPAICVLPLLCPVSSWNFEALVWRIPPTEKKCHTAVKMKIGVGVFCVLHYHKSFFFGLSFLTHMIMNSTKRTGYIDSFGFISYIYLFVVQPIGHFTVVNSVAKPLIWSEAEGDLVVIETSI